MAKPKPFKFERAKVRKQSFMVLNLYEPGAPPILDGAFQNVYPTLEEAIERAATAVEKPDAPYIKLHVVQIMHVAEPSKGSHQASGVHESP